jgi:hypothetical protein
MTNTITLNADIAYYNTYILEIEVPDVKLGNEAIFVMSKKSVGKKAKFRLLQSQVRLVTSSSGIFEGVNLYGARKRFIDSGETQVISLQQAQQCSSNETYQLLLSYQVQIPEFNRYRIEIDIPTREGAMNKVLQNKAQRQDDYRPSLVQVGARDFTERSPVVMVL